MIDFNVAVVIPAAGKSERFPGECPKQYFSVMGKPLLMYCVENFLNAPYIKKVCVVSDRPEYVEQLLETHKDKAKVVVVPGGHSRHASIRNGLSALENLDMYIKVVVVHDGARPIVPLPLLEQLITAAAVHGAAGATRPLTSTILRPRDDGSVEACLDRASHVASETPQAFLFEMLCDAYQKCSVEEIEVGTECLDLALKHCGVRGKLIPGPDSLWKVTYKKDCYSASACLREMMTRVCLLAEKETDVVRAVRDALVDNVASVETHVAGSDEKLSATCNAVVCFHDRDIDQDSQMLALADVLDIDTSGVIIHVVLESSTDGMESGSVYDLIRVGRSMMTQYEKLKKGVVMIHVTSPGEEGRLVRLISSLVLSDFTLFSGQTLFL